MRDDVYEELFVNEVISDAERIRTALAGANPDICCLCDRTCFSSYDIDFDLKVVIHETSCPQCDSYSLEVIQLRGTITEGLNTARIRTIYSCTCYTSDCNGPFVPPLSETTVQDYKTINVPTPRLLNLRAEEHHISYEPERTITVCRQCHGKIHTGEDGLEPLQPDQSRAEGLTDDTNE